MSDDAETPPQTTTSSDASGSAPTYVSPLIERLGTLAELTRGGAVGPDDGLGGGEGDGSVI